MALEISHQMMTANERAPSLAVGYGLRRWNLGTLHVTAHTLLKPAAAAADAIGSLASADDPTPMNLMVRDWQDW